MHDWKPVNGWVGRYRCPTCHCFGYRKRLTTEYGRESVIIPYICRVRSCNKWAVTKESVGRYGRNREWRCTDHRKEINEL